MKQTKFWRLYSIKLHLKVKTDKISFVQCWLTESLSWKMEKCIDCHTHAVSDTHRHEQRYIVWHTHRSRSTLLDSDTGTIWSRSFVRPSILVFSPRFLYASRSLQSNASPNFFMFVDKTIEMKTLNRVQCCWRFAYSRRTEACVAVMRSPIIHPAPHGRELAQSRSFTFQNRASFRP